MTAYVPKLYEFKTEESEPKRQKIRMSKFDVWSHLKEYLGYI